MDGEVAIIEVVKGVEEGDEGGMAWMGVSFFLSIYSGMLSTITTLSRLSCKSYYP